MVIGNTIIRGLGLRSNKPV